MSFSRLPITKKWMHVHLVCISHHTNDVSIHMHSFVIIWCERSLQPHLYIQTGLYLQNQGASQKGGKSRREKGLWRQRTRNERTCVMSVHFAFIGVTCLCVVACCSFCWHVFFWVLARVGHAHAHEVYMPPTCLSQDLLPWLTYVSFRWMTSNINVWI